MKKKNNLFKNKRGSGLVEKIMLTAFAVAAGGAVIVYTSNVIIEAKNHNVPGLNLVDDVNNGGANSSSNSIQLLAGRTYRLTYVNGDSKLTEMNSEFPNWGFYLDSIQDVSISSGTKTSTPISGNTPITIKINYSQVGSNLEGNGGTIYKYSGTFIATFTMKTNYSTTNNHAQEILENYGTYLFEQIS